MDLAVACNVHSLKSACCDGKHCFTFILYSLMYLCFFSQIIFSTATQRLTKPLEPTAMETRHEERSSPRSPLLSWCYLPSTFHLLQVILFFVAQHFNWCSAEQIVAQHFNWCSAEQIVAQHFNWCSAEQIVAQHFNWCSAEQIVAQHFNWCSAEQIVAQHFNWCSAEQIARLQTSHITFECIYNIILYHYSYFIFVFSIFSYRCAQKENLQFGLKCLSCS